LAYVFEAKRLRTGGFPIGKYVGAGGMDDFISCRYASGCPEAAMIGLYQNNDADYWRSELRRAFEADSKSIHPKLGTATQLKPVVVVPALTGELVSIHDRPNGFTLQLFHLFLDCR